MPCFRGIDISIVASHSARNLPEYPHPDGDSLGADGNQVKPPSISASLSNDPARNPRSNPQVSVYIPSTPGEQFWLRYSLKHLPTPSQYVFFKLFMNGHHTVSWGIDTGNRLTGTVTRALYEPGERWSSQAMNQDVNAVGIETRYFHFMSGSDQRSVAEDGGLIEVQVFRSEGRKRIAARLDEYRNQERYGIISPTGGLMETPEDTTYYEYHLLDARDSPYATFKFHYRSLGNLEQLSLIPQQNPAPLASLETLQRALFPFASSPRKTSRQNAQDSSVGVGALNTGVFLGFDDDAPCSKTDLDATNEYTLKSPPKGYIDPLPGAHTLPETTRWWEGKGDENLAIPRPLPKVPSNHSSRSSTCSLRSTCPSLTPSLVEYVNSDEFDQDHIMVHTARAVHVGSGAVREIQLGKRPSQTTEDAPFSECSISQDSMDFSQSIDVPGSEGDSAALGSSLEGQLHMVDPPVAQSTPEKQQSPSAHSETASATASSNGSGKTATLRLTEAEWLKRTPSPSARRQKRHPRPLARQSGSPGWLKKRTGILEGEEQPNGLTGLVHGSREWPKPGDGPDVKTDDPRPAGNWI